MRFIILCATLLTFCAGLVLSVEDEEPVDTTEAYVKPQSNPFNHIWRVIDGIRESKWEQKNHKTLLNWSGTELLQLRANSFLFPGDSKLVVDFQNHLKEARPVLTWFVHDSSAKLVCALSIRPLYSSGIKQSFELDLSICDLEQAKKIRLDVSYGEVPNFEYDDQVVTFTVLDIRTVKNTP